MKRSFDKFHKFLEKQYVNRIVKYSAKKQRVRINLFLAKISNDVEHSILFPFYIEKMYPFYTP